VPGNPRCSVRSSAPTSMPSSSAFVAATALSCPRKRDPSMPLRSDAVYPARYAHTEEIRSGATRRSRSLQKGK
jgi:hypothetical protein